jgi:hypothetical protein
MHMHRVIGRIVATRAFRSLIGSPAPGISQSSFGAMRGRRRTKHRLGATLRRLQIQEATNEREADAVG